MEHIRIDSTDIIFQDHGDGKGKIIISNDEYGYDFSYYWGAISKGDTLAKFIEKMNSGYFVSKLSHKIKGQINIRKTFVALRKYIQESFEYELKWYNHVEFQKDFREKLRNLKDEIANDIDFSQRITSFHEELNFYLINDTNERERIENLFKSIFSNSGPWNLICYDIHPEDAFLERLHAKLKDKLSKSAQLLLF